jgi:hypothetical protein
LICTVWSKQTTNKKNTKEESIYSPIVFLPNTYKPLSSEKKRRKKQGFKIEKNKQILKKKDPRFNGKIN